MLRGNVPMTISWTHRYFLFLSHGGGSQLDNESTGRRFSAELPLPPIKSFKRGEERHDYIVQIFIFPVLFVDGDE